MAINLDHAYYQNAIVGYPEPYTPRQLSKAPDGKITVMYKDADGNTNGEMDVKVIWVDDIAIYLEREPEDDFMVPWTEIQYIQIVGIK